MSKRINHTSCQKGKRVFVRLRNGQEFVDKFVEKKGRFIQTEHYRFKTSDIDIFTINKKIK